MIIIIIPSSCLKVGGSKLIFRYVYVFFFNNVDNNQVSDFMALKNTKICETTEKYRKIYSKNRKKKKKLN